MSTTRRSPHRLPSVLGAAGGLILFLTAFLKPALYFGGVIGMVIASSLYGMPVPREPWPRALVAVGMGVGALFVGGLVVAGGALAGAALGFLGGAAGRTRSAVDRPTEPRSS
jgi:hypothetical protein